MYEKSDILRDEYQLRFDKNKQYREQVWRILCDKYFSLFISPEAQVLDLGCGWGEFINNIKAAKKYAMDLNPDSGLQLPEETQFIQQDCSQKWQISSNSLDVVFTSNFLEHLSCKDHVENTLSEAYRCLKFNGLIICMGPNIKFVPGAYWDFWDHFIPITENSLAELLIMKGFSIHMKVPRFLPYSMSDGKNPPLFLINLYLKLSVLWPFFGKQFLVIGIKNDLNPK